MSWFHARTNGAESRDHASASEVMACFRDEKDLMFRLALLIAGDSATADDCVVNACETTVQGRSPFRDWLTEWAKSATITSAISRAAHAIHECEPAYANVHCSHSEHWSQRDDGERERDLNFVLGMEPGVILAELDALARAVLVLRTGIRASIQDCALRLNVSRNTALAANCRAMAWLRDAQRQHASGATARAGSVSVGGLAHEDLTQ
ncbi:MAG: hypothetical protein WCF68_12420 [Terriglobales bacterium]